MRKLWGQVILTEQEHSETQSKITRLEKEAKPNRERDLRNLELEDKHDQLTQILRDAPRLDPNNWSFIYKPWLERFRKALGDAT